MGGCCSHQKFHHIKKHKTILFLWAIFLCLIAPFSFAQKPDLFLLKTYQDHKAVTGWLMSEKLDGVRAYWDGQQLISRGGHVFKAPAWFTRGFPPFALDGELWSKRNDFENIVSIVRQQQADERWSQISYRIFEVPKQPGGLLQRLAVLGDYLKMADLKSALLTSTIPKPMHLFVIPQIEIKSQAHLDEFLQQVMRQGGEGVVIRDPAAAYQTGRLDGALKLKPFQDEECEVTGYHPGQGKYQNLVGALDCRLENQNFIRIGSGLSDEQRTNPPAIGSIITFKYNGLTARGLPRFPVFLRERPLVAEW
ncbi:MAG: DNA ligase [Gammaproteobacteria bacterium]|nr:DNA ligase [Gammaproteobacteria bacterium]